MIKILFAATFFLLGVYLYTYVTPHVFAQTPCQVTGAGEESFADGLISAGGGITGKVDSATGACVVDPAAKYATYELPKNYEELKNTYYLRAKPPANAASSSNTQGAIKNLDTKNQIYNFTGNFSVSAPITGTNTGIIFIDGNLDINSNIDYPSPTGGLVFVVKGNVLISGDTKKIDAVIISFGTICTIANGGTCAPTPTLCPGATSATIQCQLVVNGSLISLNVNQPILFRRTLIDNQQAAELIKQQPKFLVLLKDIFSETLEIRNEY